jgi:hypothetical protein
MKLNEHNRRVKKAIVEAVAERLVEDDAVHIESVWAEKGNALTYLLSTHPLKEIRVEVPIRGKE